jgi:hypothetical protein
LPSPEDRQKIEEERGEGVRKERTKCNRRDEKNEKNVCVCVIRRLVVLVTGVSSQTNSVQRRKYFFIIKHTHTHSKQQSNQQREEKGRGERTRVGSARINFFAETTVAFVTLVTARQEEKGER